MRDQCTESSAREQQDYLGKYLKWQTLPWKGFPYPYTYYTSEPTFAS